METWEARLAALEAQVSELQRARHAAEERVSVLERRLRRGRWMAPGAGLLLLVLGLLIGPPQAGIAQGGTLDQRVAVLEGKLARVFVVNGGNDIVISGANLNLVNGAGSTQTANGRGNLIIGYNEARGGGADARNGSHNLVLGQQANYTSFGGIVGGYQNTIAGPFAHALTGNGNGALSFYTCIASGYSNNATGLYAAILGGQINVASGDKACISGGRYNTASGESSSVSGGQENTASGLYASVSGGLDNSAGNAGASVSGGWANTASGERASVSGGLGNTASGRHASASGGSGNTASGERSSVSGGSTRSATGPLDWRAGNLLEDM
jgi:hypothetical protein